MVCGIGKDVMEQNQIATKFLQHHTSFQHTESVAAHAHYLDIKSGKFQSVAKLPDAEHARLIKDNRHYLRTVAEVLLLTAQQKIAQRDTGRSFRVKNIMIQSLTFGQSCGNFPAILSVVARHDPVIAERIQYTDLQMQNTPITPSRMLC